MAGPVWVAMRRIRGSSWGRSKRSRREGPTRNAEVRIADGAVPGWSFSPARPRFATDKKRLQSPGSTSMVRAPTPPVRRASAQDSCHASEIVHQTSEFRLPNRQTPRRALRHLQEEPSLQAKAKVQSSEPNERPPSELAQASSGGAAQELEAALNHAKRLGLLGQVSRLRAAGFFRRRLARLATDPARVRGGY